MKWSTKPKGIQLSALFLAMLLVCMVFVPAVGANAEKSLKEADDVGRLIKLDSPTKLELKENTKTSTIVQVGDVLISLKSNPQHTEAVMVIQDLETGENETIKYEVSSESGKFITDVYYEGELKSTYTTSYDPLEPDAAGYALKNNANATQNTGEMAIRSYNTWWDSVYFVKGSGIKYPHPDCGYYGIDPWDECYISGSELKHYHIADWESEIIAQMAPVVAGAAIGAYVGSVVGAVVGALLGLVIGGASSHILLDETGCIWFWYAKSWGWIVIPVPPYFTNIPKYFRIAEYTLWDTLGVGNP